MTNALRWTTHLLLGAAGLGLPAASAAQTPTPTTVVVRAIAQDAKIIGSGVGGARITIRDTQTGDILATGVQEGGTGDTQAIMGDRPREGGVFDTEGAGQFVATLDLVRPTRVLIEAVGPLDTPHASQSATVSLLLVPGHDITGDGVILTLHGFTVEVIDAPTEATPGERIGVRARVTMLCGCPTEPDGLWDSSSYTLSADLVFDGAVVASQPLTWTGETSIYEGEITIPTESARGALALRLVAVHAESANAGMVQQAIRIR